MSRSGYSDDLDPQYLYNPLPDMEVVEEKR